MRTILRAVVIAFVLSGSANAATQAVLHKNPNCGCCDEYAKELEKHGYQVTLEDTTDLKSVRMAAGVPEQLAGCHTMIIGDYVIEGLVPVNIVDRLLREKPPIRGISLPGMPVGAPGMPGPKEGTFQIYEIKDGEQKIYAVE
jgi:hypothetical protein